MKKFLLSILAMSVVAAATAFDFNLDKGKARFVNGEASKPFSFENFTKKAPAKTASRASGYGAELRFCGELYSWAYVQGEYDLVQYIYITPEIATMLAGNQVMSVRFSVSFDDYATINDKIDGEIFVTENIMTFPEDSTVTKSVKIVDSYLQYVNDGAPSQLGIFSKGTYYTIKENTGFYFGVKYHANNFYAIAVDQNPTNQFCGGVLAYKDGEYVGYLDPSTICGTNLFMYAQTIGENKEIRDLFTVYGSTIGSFTYPVMNDSISLPASILINNMGGNELTSIDYTYFFTDSVKTTGSAEINIEPLTTDWAEINIPNYPVGHDTLYIYVDSINKQEVGLYSKLPFMNLGDKGYPRKFVVEEGTGMWCGYCPRGIVGLDYMNENYPDDFVGIAVHVATQSGADRLNCESYLPFVEEYIDGFPMSVINRDPNFAVDPNAETLEYAYTYWDMYSVAPAMLSLDIEPDTAANVMKVSADVNFAIDIPNANYSLAFVLLENGLKGNQTNYFSGGQYGEMDGWEDYPNPKSWIYGHTARQIFDVWGLENSVPTNIEGGKTYNYSTELSLSKIYDIEKTYAVALLIDNESGVIMNASDLTFVNKEAASVEDIIAPAVSAPAVYYNLQGQKVANPRKGSIVIRLADGKASKVVF